MSAKIHAIAEQLIIEAQQSDMDSKHACAILNGKNNIIGVNHSRTVSHGNPCFSIHAEQDALIKYLKLKKLHWLIDRINDLEYYRHHVHLPPNAGAADCSMKRCSCKQGILRNPKKKCFSRKGGHQCKLSCPENQCFERTNRYSQQHNVNRKQRALPTNFTKWVWRQCPY